MSNRHLGCAFSLLLAGAALAQTSSSLPLHTHDPARHQGEFQRAAELLPPTYQPGGRFKVERVTVAVESTGTTRQPSLQVLPGDVLLVHALHGQWTVDTRSIKPVGLAGHVQETTLHKDWGHRRMVTSLPFGRLLLRVGSGPWVDAGAGQPIRTLVGGRVELNINDNGDSLADNAGTLDVELAVERAGAASTPSRPVDQGTAETPQCSKARQAFTAQLDALSRDCRQDQDCSLLQGFSTCSDTLAVSRKAAGAFQDALLQGRKAAWNACAFVPPPCSQVPLAARCVASRCQAGPIQNAPPPEAPDGPRPRTCADSLCPPGQRCVMHQVMCASAPCPPLPMCVAR